MLNINEYKRNGFLQQESSSITIVDTKTHPAQWNMDWDREQLETLDIEGPAIIHFYEWKNPSITFGHFIDPVRFFLLHKIEEHGIDLARRPTGGGITFHLGWDFAFSLLIPAQHPFFSCDSLENYRRVNRSVAFLVKFFLEQQGDLQKEDSQILQEYQTHFCMARATKYDVIVEGKKVAGAAQRKTKRGFLHQGTIFLQIPDFSLLKEILHPSISLSKENSSIVPLLQEGGEMEAVKAEIRKLLLATLQKNLLSYL